MFDDITAGMCNFIYLQKNVWSILGNRCQRIDKEPYSGIERKNPIDIDTSQRKPSTIKLNRIDVA